VRGTDGSDVLTGSDERDKIYGFNGDDTIISSYDSGSDHVYGGAGLDTFVYEHEMIEGDKLKNLSPTPQANDLSVLKHWRWYDESPDVIRLFDVERIVLLNTKFALDLDGHAGFVVKLLGVLFGQHKLLDKNLVGQSLSILDEGKSQNELVASTLKDAGFIDANYSDTNKLHSALVTTLWENAVGGSYVPESAKPFVEGLDEGSFSMVELVNVAANTDYNKTAIDLTGLMTSGIEYL
jgi:hypothetical protein